MSLFLQLRRLSDTALWAVLFYFKILPAHSFAVLLQQTNSADSVSRFGTIHAEDCALTAWHNGDSVMREMDYARDLKHLSIKYQIPNSKYQRKNKMRTKHKI